MVGPIPSDESAETIELVEHGRFVRNLAWRLLHDEDAAEEVVQETMLAAVTAKPTRDRPLRPWLATVARNVIRRRFRTQSRVRTREQAAAKPEALPSAADMVARAEMLRQVVDAVLSLDEPNRSTVLLRYYEDLPPREIAVRQDVGVETVRGRLKRAVKQLRVRLDRWHPGGRAGWAPLLAGLCGLDVPAELLAAASGSATATAAAETTTPLFAGALSVAAAFLVGAGLSGAFVWQAARPRADAPSTLHAGSLPGARRAPDAEALASDPEGRPAVLRGRVPTAREIAHLEAENEALRARVETLRATQRTLAPPRDPERFRFALPDHAPAFDGADWANLARHVLAMAELMPEVRAAVLGERSIPPHVQTQARMHNVPLAHLALKLGPELETSNPNQAYTHPAVLANLVRAALLVLEDPLSREQEIAVRALGDAWAHELVRVKGEFTEDTPALARLVAEGEAKLRFLAALKGVLSYSQHEALYDPETEGIVQLDLLAPGWDFMQRHFVKAPDAATLETRLLSVLLELAGVEVEDVTPYAWIGREWVAAVPHATEDRTWVDASLSFPSVEDVLTMAQAEVDAIERIVAVGGLDAEASQRLRAVATVFVPHLHAEEPEESEDPSSD